MKTLIFLALLLPVVAAGQSLEMDSTTGKYMYRRVVTVDSAKAGQLYERAKQWMARDYQSADAVIQYDSKEEGKIIGRGYWGTYAALGEQMEHILIIECRDGRVRYTFTDFVKVTTDATLGKVRKNLESVKMFKKTEQESFAKEAARTGSELEKALKTQPSKKDDRW